MDWDYFIDDGRFKAKRLPFSSKRIKAKDCTGLSGIRDCLKDTTTISESIEAYKHCFDRYSAYEVEIETFDELFNRNPDGFLGNLTKFKSNYYIIENIFEWFDSEKEYEWYFIETSLANQLKNEDLITIKENIDENDWVEYLTKKYNLKEMNKICEDYSLKIHRTKNKSAKTQIEAINTGLLKLKNPCPIRPNENLTKWHENLQMKFIHIIESVLSEFDYPEMFISAVWNDVLGNNPYYELIENTINKNMQDI